MPSKRLALLAAPLAIAAFAAAPAGAATYCVHQAGDPCAAGTIDSDTDLQSALDAANLSAEEDTVAIGPGTFTAPANGFHAGVSSVTHIVGSGPSTVLDGATSPILTANGQSVSSLAVHVNPASFSMGVLSGTNAASGGDLDHLTITGGANQSRGVGVSGPITLRDSTVSVNANAGGNGVVAASTASGAPTIQDSTIVGSIGVFAAGNLGLSAVTTVRRTQLTAYLGVQAAAAHVAIDDSVVRVTNGGTGVEADCSGNGSASLDADHLTIQGLAGNVSATSAGCATSGKSAALTMTNSTVHGHVHWASGNQSNGATASITVEHSDIALTSPSGNATLSEGSGGNIAVADPGFVSATDLHLKADSPLIDAGAPGTPLHATDRDGLARLSGAAQDLGAYEYQVPAPSGGGGGGGGGGQKADAPTTPPADVASSDDAPGQTQPAPPATARPIAPAAGPTAAQIRASLKVSMATAAATRYAYAWLTAGTVRIEWRVGTTVVARGAALRTAAGSRGAVHLVVTARGRALLRTHHRVTVRASFTPHAGTAVSTSSIRKVG